jgi:hypothetical protein
MSAKASLVFNVKWFDPTKMVRNPVVLIVGRRGTGKTTVSKNLIYPFRNVDIGVLFSNTARASGDWDGYFAPSFVYDKYDSDVMKDILDELLKAKTDRKNDPRIPQKDAMVFCDDCTFDRSGFGSDPQLKRAAMNGRHSNLKLFITMQYAMAMDRDFRAQVDYVFILKNNIIGDRERLWNNWFGVIPEFGVFDKIMTELTGNRGVMVLDNTAQSQSIEDSIFYYRATNIPVYKIGSWKSWVYHYARTKGRVPPVERRQKSTRKKKESDVMVIKRA